MFKLKNKVKFNHLGIAVKNFNKCLKFYTSLGYRNSKPTIELNQNVEIIMLISDLMPNIELVKSINEESPVNNLLKKNNENIYHICYEVENLQEVLKLIKKSVGRIICVSKPKEAIIFNNRLVSFYYIKDIGIVEFLEK